jgi:hypothetical protein
MMRSLAERCNCGLTAVAAQSHDVVIARLDRAIQYAAASRLTTTALEYWMPRFRGA